MGIKNLLKFFKDKCPRVFQEVPLSEYKNKRIAIDVYIYLYKYKSIFRDNWLSSFYNLTLLMKKYEITCVYVFDTKAPKEKDPKKNERKIKKKNVENKIKSIKSALEEYKTDNNNVNSALTDIMAKYKVDNASTVINVTDEEIKQEIIDVSVIEKEIELLNRYNISISKRDLDTVKELLNILNISYYNSVNEAETLCAHMCCHGVVDAVLSDDTDVLAYGTNVFLTKLNMTTETVTRLIFSDILSALELTREQFVDFCIMCETDYNKNIRGVAYIKAFKLIKDYGSIENIEQLKRFDVSVLNHVRVREIFSIPETLDNEYVLKSCICLNEDELKEFISKYNINTNKKKKINLL